MRPERPPPPFTCIQRTQVFQYDEDRDVVYEVDASSVISKEVCGGGLGLAQAV